MSQTLTERFNRARFVAHMPVRAEWEEEATGRHIVADGRTENIGPDSAVVSLRPLPTVGSHITIRVSLTDGEPMETETEVIRLVRDLQEPRASLSVRKDHKQWRDQVWEPSALIESRAAVEGRDEDIVN